MPTITLSATPKGNGYQATVTFPDDGVSISSAETYPTIAEAMTAAAMKLLFLTSASLHGGLSLKPADQEGGRSPAVRFGSS